jgi:HK97 family phage portal protein
MSLWSRLMSGFRPRAEIDSSQVRRGDGVWEAFTGSSTNTGPLSEQTALTISAVYACVNLIGGAISAMPMHIYRRDSRGDLDRDINHPLWWMLNEEFSPRWSAAAGWSFLCGSRLLHGDAFAEILRGRNGEILGLMPLHPNRVESFVTSDGARLVYRVQPDTTIDSPSTAAAQTRVIDQDDVLHVPGFGFNGRRSLSPLRHALRATGRLAESAQTFSSSFLQNSARPELALMAKGELTDEQFARLQLWIEKHAGTKNAGRPMLLEGGLEVKTLTMPMEEMQLLETRRFSVEEIARVYGVPPFMIGHTDKTTSWGSGVGAMGTGFVRFTLRDHLNAFHNEINRKFFRRATPVALFDTSDLEQADLKSLFETFRIALGRAGEPGWMSIEEVRERCKLKRVPEGSLASGQAPATSQEPSQ